MSRLEFNPNEYVVKNDFDDTVNFVSGARATKSSNIPFLWLIQSPSSFGVIEDRCISGLQIELNSLMILSFSSRER